MIHSIGDTYRYGFIGMGESRCLQQQRGIDCCIKGGKLLGERWFVAGSRWGVDHIAILFCH